MRSPHDFTARAVRPRRYAGNIGLAFTPLKCFVVLGVCLQAVLAFGQDPAQPATNLSLTSVLDGAAPGPGTYWFQYVQYYHANRIAGPAGDRVGNARVKTTLYMQQLVHMSRKKWLGGNVGFTVLVPLVNINTDGEVIPGKVPLTSNPSLMGDLIVGPSLQWLKGQLLGKPFHSRLALDFVLPTGAYDPDYAINAGSNYLTIEPHYTFTYFITPRLSTSQRHHYTYHFENPQNRYRTGQMYHLNYALEYAVCKTFRAGVIGYYLTQFTNDQHRGDDRYFQETFGLSNTRERVFAVGPSLSLVSPRGIFFELKSAFEAAAVNRPEGIRTTFRLIYRFKDAPAGTPRP
ncbi:MAG TPA: transporter [Cytophagales bacterium]